MSKMAVGAPGPDGARALTGLMQLHPLTLDRMVDHASRWHGSREVVSRRLDGATVRSDWATVRTRSRAASAALLTLGIGRGARVATLAMNSEEHLAAWFGIMGIGAVCHTLNPRLSEDQLVYIVNHAQDRLVFADAAFAELVDRLRPHCPSIEHVIILDDGAAPPEAGRAWSCFLEEGSVSPTWGGFDENAAAALCYTSGTTGRPKGVLYSHRSNYLHALMLLPPDVFGLAEADVVLPAVPMFHAMAWGIPFAAAAVGAKLVLPGARLDGAALYQLIEAERVTYTAGVPTVWQGLLAYVEENDLRFSTLKRVTIGGAACPEALMAGFAARGVEARHAWGMTEMSPLGVSGAPTALTASLDGADFMAVRLKQGRPPLGVDLRLVDATGAVIDRDGVTPGHLQARGDGVLAAYFQDDRSVLDPDGFFDTGDIATIDPAGFMRITDRAKDLIKSGGEWISSLDVENAASSHRGVAMAAVIAVPHPRWGERPMLIVKPAEGAVLCPEELRAFLGRRLAKWEVPEAIRFVAELPVGPTGKIDKKALRERYPTAEGAEPGDLHDLVT